MRYKSLTIAMLLFICGCAANLEGTQFPYLLRQLRFYNEFIVGDNQVLKINNSNMKVEYNVTEEDGRKGGYYIIGKLYADTATTGYVGVAIADTDWKIIAHVPGTLEIVASSPTLGCPFSAYINPELYDVSKFKYLSFGIKK